jgi:hypothetical protein
MFAGLLEIDESKLTIDDLGDINADYVPAIGS